MQIINMNLLEITPYERNPGNNEAAEETVAGLLAINLRSGIVRLDADERGVHTVDALLRGRNRSKRLIGRPRTVWRAL